MPDYNLGRAHGTIRVDYDGSGVRQADDDLNKLGDTTEETSRRTTQSIAQSSADYDHLAAAAKRLEQEVVRASAAEVSARARAAAAHEHLINTQNDASSSVQTLMNAQRQLTSETKRYEDAVMRAQNANRALLNIRRDLANARPPHLIPADEDSKFSSLLGHLRNIDKQTRTTSGVLNTFRSRLAIMIGAAALATPTIAGLGVALVSLAGLAGVAAGALASLAAVGGTLATAFSGIAQVFKVAGQQQAGAGQSAAQAASQQRAAARQIEQAIRGVRDAQEALDAARRDAARTAIQAAQQIIQAERQLRDAQFDALRAQENLTRARRDASRQLEDLRSQLTGGALDERQGILDVQRAQEELNKTLADPRSSETDRQQAVLNLEKQKQALDDLRTRNKRLADDQAEAAAAGVEGSNQVVDAQREVIHTNEQSGDAALGVADAVVSAAQQQIDAQRDIRNATEAVADAQKDLAEAYLNAAEAGGGGAAKMADALANISPEAQKLVKAILAQSDAWKQVKFAVQDALFSGLDKEVAPLANKWLPLLRDGMVKVASALREVIVELITFFSKAETMNDVSTIFDNTAQSVHNLVPGLAAILKIFLNLATVGSSFLPKLAEGFSRWATNLANVADESRKTGELQSWMQDAMTAAHQLGQLLGNLAGIISTVFRALNSEGGNTLQNLANLTQRIEDFLNTAEGQDILHALGETLSALAHLVGDVLIGALQLLGPAFVSISPLIQRFAEVLGTEVLVAAKLLAPVLKIIADTLAFLGPVLGPLIASIFFLNKAVTIATAVWKLLNGTLKANPFIAIAAAVIAIAFLIIENWDAIKKFLSETWQWIQDQAGLVWEAIKLLIVTPVQQTVQAITEAWNGFIAWITGLWNGFIGFTIRAWEAIRRAIIDPVANAIENVLNFFRDLPGNIASFFADAGNWLFDAGKNIIEGLIRGLKNVAGRVIDFFKNLIKNAIGTVFDLFGISSPSKVFKQIGEFTWEGYLVGIKDMKDPVVQRMTEIAVAAVSAGTPQQLVPTGAMTPSVITPSFTAPSSEPADRTVVVHNLSLTVTGNLDPTNPVQWRRALKEIRSGIQGVDRSEQ